MRPGADQDPVAATRVLRVAHDRANVLLIADVHEDARGTGVLEDRVEHHVDGTATGRGRDLGDRASDESGEGGVRRAGDLDLRPIGLLAVEAVAADLLELHAHGFPACGVEGCDGPQQIAARCQPARQ